MEIAAVMFSDVEVQRLVADLQQEFVRRYGGPDETPLDPDMFVLPRGQFFKGAFDGVAVALGGWRLRPDVQALGGVRAAEIKRMYVVPAVQRRGYARQMLRHLEFSSARAGADVLVLETGTEQPEAIGLYVSSGYEPVPGFGIYAHEPSVRYFGKRV